MKRRYRVAISLLLLIFTVVASFVTTGKAKYSFTEVYNNKPIYRVNTEEKKLALTFDINWAEKEELFNILEVLDKYNVKATFFYNGRLGKL